MPALHGSKEPTLARTSEGVVRRGATERRLRSRRNQLIHSVGVQFRAAETAAPARQRSAERLRDILRRHPRARYFSIGRIISALDPAPEPGVALFSAAAAFDMPDVGFASGAVVGALGARMAIGGAAPLPRALWRRKIPRQALAALIHAVATLFEKAESLLKPRWSWASRPIVRGALGILIFLLGVACVTPAISLRTHHAASALLVAMGLAERDGLVIVIGVIAGVASLVRAATSLTSGARLLEKFRSWAVSCFAEIRFGILAFIAKWLDPTLEAVLNFWRRHYVSLFLGDVYDSAPPTRSDVRASLRKRAEFIRRGEAERQRTIWSRNGS